MKMPWHGINSADWGSPLLSSWAQTQLLFWRYHCVKTWGHNEPSEMSCEQHHYVTPEITHSPGRVRQNWLSRANQSPRPKKVFKVPGCTWSGVESECLTYWGGENSCNEFQRCHEQAKYPTTWDWIINDAAPKWMTRYPENWLDQGTHVV